MRMAMDRQAFGQLPSLDRSNAAPQVRGNCFPAVEAIRSFWIGHKQI
jgi:hypothetical protein